MAKSHSCRVLIVEDDPAIRDVYAELLRSEGYVVSEAGNGAQALRLLTDGVKPALIIIDLFMPVLDGWGLAAKIAATPSLAAIPFIVLSARPGGSAPAAPPGASARLTKPVALQALLDAVERYAVDGRRSPAVTNQRA